MPRQKIALLLPFEGETLNYMNIKLYIFNIIINIIRSYQSNNMSFVTLVIIEITWYTLEQGDFKFNDHKFVALLRSLLTGKFTNDS